MDIYPEYDPYKYNSFPVQAGQEMFSQTQVLTEKVLRLSAHDKAALPPILAFMSATDATVNAAAVKYRLLDRLEDPRHQLVLFDVNHLAEAEGLLRQQHLALVREILAKPQPFSVRLITNRAEPGQPIEARVHEQFRAAEGHCTVTRPLNLSWPDDVYSLSHVALPFAPDDPINGDRLTNRPEAGPVYLGGGGVRGERGAFIVSMDQLARLRFNPFFDYVAERSVAFMVENVKE